MRTRISDVCICLRTASFCALAVLLVASASWLVKSVGRERNRRQTTMNFQVILTSISAYSHDFKHLPFPVQRAPTQPEKPEKMYFRNGEGEELYSWRVEIIPYLESWHGSWDRFQRWDAPANQVLREMFGYYAYEGRSFSSGVSGATQAFPETNTVAVIGNGTAFGDGWEQPMSLGNVPPSAILFVETNASGIPWPAPGDFSVQEIISGQKRISGQYAGGFHVGFADGVWFVSDKTPLEALKKFFTVAGARKYDREMLLGPFALERHHL